MVPINFLVTRGFSPRRDGHYTLCNMFRLRQMMSALNYIRPIPNIDGTVCEIWAKCKDEHFQYVLGSAQEIGSDDMDV
jgi:hypothetical protein